jgi:hypothetical protein
MISLLCCSLVVALCSAVSVYQHCPLALLPPTFSEEGNSSSAMLVPTQQTASSHNQKITTHVLSLDLSTGSGMYTKFNQNINSQCTLTFFISNLNKNTNHQIVTLSHSPCCCTYGTYHTVQQVFHSLLTAFSLSHHVTTVSTCDQPYLCGHQDSAVMLGTTDNHIATNLYHVHLFSE